MESENQNKFSRIKKWKPDGIILRETGQTHKILSKILDLNIPTIISYTQKYVLGAPGIVTNCYKAGQMAAEHLLDRCFRHFAYYGFDDRQWSIERSKGFIERITKAGFNTHIRKISSSVKEFTWEKQQDNLAEWLKSLPKPLALLACTAELSNDAVEACKIAGLNLPEELAIISGHDDDIICNFSNPQISSIALNVIKAGYEAAELLDKMMAGQKVARKLITVEPTHIKVRQSTDIMAIDDKQVAKALHFIRTNSKKPITVGDVLDHITLSQNELCKRTQKLLGRTIHEEIARARTEKIAQMLLKTDLSIAQIAFKLGFPDNTHISRYFKRQMGISPKDYRQKYSQQ
jgi:LacI family transcriptional regulator